ncbi:MAG: radical SAM protein, partial [Planctomycetes bacterium]|nr:radical SAM protein [Planctomycetota bacterium]
MKRQKLVLVNPVNNCRNGFSVNSSSRFPPLGLGIIASLTPDAWDIDLVDENFSPFTYRDADLVGITAFTSAATRAYEIAVEYRQRGVPVVMGGIHASMRHEEALQFVDAVVIGEAESAWPQVLADVARGELKPVYRGQWLDLAGLRAPQRDLYNGDYMFATVQTSRGCPLDCDFCSVTAFNGRRYRRRPTDEVLDEIESIPQELLLFVDDNVVGYGNEARQQTLEL